MLQYIPWHPINRREMLHQLIKGGVGAEVGVHIGDYAHFILEYTKPAILYLVDKWPDREIVNGPKRVNGLEAKRIVENRFADQIEAGVVEIIQCSSLDLDEHIVPGSLDWIYLDTSHRYPDTLDELRILASLLKPGGLLLGHDYNKDVGQGYFSVERAIKEFLEESNYFMVLLTLDHPSSFGIACCHAFSPH